MSVLYSNNAYSTLASAINASATSITVATGEGARFPAISTTGDYFYLTLANASVNEIVKVTARSSDTMTITRAQDGTTAQSFSTSDSVQLKVNKGMLDGIKSDVNDYATAMAIALG